MPFGKWLKEARIRSNMTQEDLAKKVGVTKGAIGNYESEVSSPKETILIELMKVLHIDANYLYQDYIKTHDLTEEEQILITLYRNAEPIAQDIAIEALKKHQRKDTEQSAI